MSRENGFILYKKTYLNFCLFGALVVVGTYRISVAKIGGDHSFIDADFL